MPLRDVIRCDRSMNVAAAVPSVPGAQLAVTLFEPPGCRELSGAVVVCSPGGTYPRGYFDLEVAGRSSYSTAAALASAGHFVLTIDTLGTGASSRPADGDAVDLAAAAAALTSATEQLRREVLPVCIVGLGHSLGAAITLAAQAAGEPFEALALLGYCPAWQAFPSERIVDTGAPELRRRDALTALSARDPQLWATSYVAFPREASHALAHRPDVPDDVVAALEHDITPVPRALALDYGDPRIALPLAARIRVPVLLGFGDHDAAVEPDAECAHYPNAAVSVCVVPDCGHMHAAATHRAKLWHALDGWITSMVNTKERASHVPA